MNDPAYLRAQAAALMGESQRMDISDEYSIELWDHAEALLDEAGDLEAADRVAPRGSWDRYYATHEIDHDFSMNH